MILPLIFLLRNNRRTAGGENFERREKLRKQGWIDKLFLMVGEVKGGGDEDDSADNITNKDEEDIHEHARDIEGSRGEEASWDIEKIGDAVLEARGDEESDWEDAGEEFARGGFTRKSHIDAGTDEDIAKNP